MQYFLFVIISYLLIDNSISYSVLLIQNKSETQISQKNDTLIFAQVIYRHGDRNIKIGTIYPNDPYKDEIHSPEGYEQLTQMGKRQLYELGQYFRRRYDKLLGNKYSPNKVYIQSTDVDRTLMSAQVNLAGIFHPSKEEKWNEEISWIPIPVHTVPKQLDYILYGGKKCPKYRIILEKYLNESPEVRQIYTEYANVFSQLSEKSGLNITKIQHIAWIYKTLFIEKSHNKSLPNWADKIMQPMEYIASFHYKALAATSQLARLKSGFLLKEIIERFYQKVQSTLKPDRSVWFYCAHEHTISNMLNGLELFEIHIPPYGSSVHFELYKTDEAEHYVQLFYRKLREEFPTPMNIPNCGEKCPLEQFYAIYEHIIPVDFDSECNTV